MRIVVWNCRMGLKAKLPQLLTLEPTIVVAPEAGDPSRAATPWLDPTLNSPLWTGRNKNKGLLAFVCPPADGSQPVTLRLAECFDERFEWFLPVQVHDAAGREILRILAAWSMDMPMRGPGYGGRLGLALDHYAPWLAGFASVVAGDFNSNCLWDQPDRPYSFQHAITRLGDLGLQSAYHFQSGERHGKESKLTHFWMYRRPFHIDYAFVPEAWLRSDAFRFQLLDYADWRPFSDHAPLVLDCPV